MKIALANIFIFLFIVSSVNGQRNTVNSDELWPLVNDYWSWRLRTSPEYGTKYGFFEHDNDVENYSEAAINRQYNYAKGLLKRSKTIDTSKLVNQDKVTLAVMQANLDTFIDGYSYKHYSLYNQIGRVGSVNDDPLGSWKSLIKWKTLKTEQDYSLWLKRLKKFPTQFQQRKQLMAKALEAGTTFHELSLNPFIQSLGAEINNLKTSVYKFSLFTPFANFPNEFSEKTRGKLLEKVAKLKDPILRSLESFAEFVRNEYLPRSRPIIGVHSLPGGAEFYQSCLKWHTSLDLTAKEIHDIGLQEVDRILKNIKKEAKGFDSVREYLNFVQQQPENYFQTEQEVTAYYQQVLDDTLSKLNLVVNTVPKMPVSLSIDPKAGIGFYSDPALDGSRAGIIYMSNTPPKSKYKFSILPMMLHEGVPGHHLQSAYAAETDMPYFRRGIEFRKYYGVPFNWPFHTAYIEGWGLYAETLGTEMGVYNKPYAQTGFYTNELLRAARLVVDTGIHALNWTFDQSVEYFKEVTTLDDASIRDEVVRYITWPGQATAYKIGSLKFLELRQEASSKLGDKFNLKDFHDEILKLGPVPLSLMEEQINKWIDAQL